MAEEIPITVKRRYLWGRALAEALEAFIVNRASVFHEEPRIRVRPLLMKPEEIEATIFLGGL